MPNFRGRFYDAENSTDGEVARLDHGHGREPEMRDVAQAAAACDAEALRLGEAPTAGLLD